MFLYRQTYYTNITSIAFVLDTYNYISGVIWRQRNQFQINENDKDSDSLLFRETIQRTNRHNHFIASLSPTVIASRKEKASRLMMVNTRSHRANKRRKVQQAALDNPDVLAKVFSFLDAIEDIPKIAAVSRLWKNSLGTVEDKIWECCFRKYYPEIASMMELMTSRDSVHVLPHLADWNKSWKALYKKRATYKTDFVAHNLNKKLQKDLEFVFRPLGIWAFSTDCGSGICTRRILRSYIPPRQPFRCGGRYYLERSIYQPEEPKFLCLCYNFDLQLNGRCYKDKVEEVRIRDYGPPENFRTSATWKDNCSTIMAWCAMLRKQPSEYTIGEPIFDANALFNVSTTILFQTPLFLEPEGDIEWWDCTLDDSSSSDDDSSDDDSSDDD